MTRNADYMALPGFYFLCSCEGRGCRYTAYTTIMNKNYATATDAATLRQRCLMEINMNCLLA